MPHADTLVSYFPDSLKPKLLETLPLPKLLAGIRDGRWAEQVQTVRALDPTSDAYSEAKKKLPGFTASGWFKQRNAAGLVQHSGFMCLDIDAKSNPGWTYLLLVASSKPTPIPTLASPAPEGWAGPA